MVIDLQMLEYHEKCLVPQTSSHVSRLKYFLHVSDLLIGGVVLFQEIRGQCKVQINNNLGPGNDASSELKDTHGVGCMAWIS